MGGSGRTGRACHADSAARERPDEDMGTTTSKARVPLATSRVASVWFASACRKSNECASRNLRPGVQGAVNVGIGKGAPCQWHTVRHRWHVGSTRIPGVSVVPAAGGHNRNTADAERCLSHTNDPVARKTQGRCAAYPTVLQKKPGSAEKPGLLVRFREAALRLAFFEGRVECSFALFEVDLAHEFASLLGSVLAIHAGVFPFDGQRAAVTDVV